MKEISMKNIGERSSNNKHEQPTLKLDKSQMTKTQNVEINLGLKEKKKKKEREKGVKIC